MHEPSTRFARASFCPRIPNLDEHYQATYKGTIMLARSGHSLCIAQYAKLPRVHGRVYHSARSRSVTACRTFRDYRVPIIIREP